MTKKFYSIAASCAFAMAFGLSACSGDSSSGADANIDTGDEINIPISDKVSSATDEDVSSSSKIDSIKVTKNDPDDSDDESSSSAEKSSTKSSAADAESSSSAKTVKPESSSSETSTKEDTGFLNEGWREDCLAKINEFRATEDQPPLSLAAEEKQLCADESAAADLAENSPHGHFGDCGEFAQNSGPNFSAGWLKSATAVSDYYLTMMWEDEKALVTSGERDLDKQEDYPYIGHYKNMRSKSYTKVACGIALSSDGKTGWFNVNFY